MADPPLLTRSFLLLVTGHFLQGLGFASVLLLPLYLTHLGATRTEIGLAMAAGSIGGIASRPLVAWALDRVGRRPTLLAGTVVLALAMAALAAASSMGPYVHVVRIVFGLGQGTLFAGYFTLAADLVPEARRTEGIALFGVSGLVPIGLGAFVEVVDLGPGQLRWVFPAAAVLVLASIAAVVRLPEPARAAAPPEGGSVWRTLRQPRLVPVWFATAVFAGVMAAFMAFVTVVAARRGVRWPAGVWLPYAIGAVGVRLVAARLPDRVGPRNVVAPALGLYVGALLIAARADGDGGFLLAGLLGGAAHGICFPVLAAQAVTRAPARWRGAVVAMFTAVWQLSEMLAPPVCGALADHLGDAVMLVMVGLLACGSLVPWLLLEHALARPPR